MEVSLAKCGSPSFLPISAPLQAVKDRPPRSFHALQSLPKLSHLNPPASWLEGRIAEGFGSGVVGTLLIAHWFVPIAFLGKGKLSRFLERELSRFPGCVKDPTPPGTKPLIEAASALGFQNNTAASLSRFPSPFQRKRLAGPSAPWAGGAQDSLRIRGFEILNRV